MTSKIKVRASKPNDWSVTWLVIDLCQFQCGAGFGAGLGPWVSVHHPLRDKNLVRLRLDGPRGGERASTYLTKEQAMELASAISTVAQNLP